MLCLQYSTFALGEGETIAESSASMHVTSITVVGPKGRFSISESDIIRPPSGRRKLVFQRGQTRVYRVGDQARRYAVYGLMAFWDGEVRMVAWLNIEGTAKDTDIYSRMEVRDPSSVDCQCRFGGFLL